MIKREIEPYILKLAKEYGVVSITGPRQSGKTTIVKSLFPKYEYINLEYLADYDRIKADMSGFIANTKKGVIIDEIQKLPELLSYIQVSIDETYKAGKFIITGSQNLLLSEKVSQSLAGRVGIVELLPLSISELNKKKLFKENYLEAIINGFYPGVYSPKRNPSIYYKNYLHTYVERDVRSIKNVGNLSTFNRFLQLLAGRIGQLINLTEIGGLLGIDKKTVSSWISILEASYIIIRLQPYFNNYGKRITKSPRIYFTDVGLATHLLKIERRNELMNYHGLGALYENMIIMDMYKYISNIGSSTGLYFYRDSKGHEVDLIVDTGITQIPVEIKASSTFNKEFLKGLNYFSNLSKYKGIKYVMYSGRDITSIEGFRILNHKKIKQIPV